MFQGNAEEAMRFYVSLFPDGEVIAIKRYGPGEAGAEGAVWTASFSVGTLVVKCIDSPIKHDFNFTPSFAPRSQAELWYEETGTPAAGDGTRRRRSRAHALGQLRLQPSVHRGQ
jgi:predicted 3-demethylubiquinone-9 3-methyltransferase (glyoxalase superfamily)